MSRLLLTSCSHYCTVHDNQTMIQTFLDFKINDKFNYLAFSQQCGEITFSKNTYSVQEEFVCHGVHHTKYVCTHAHTHT